MKTPTQIAKVAGLCLAVLSAASLTGAAAEAGGTRATATYQRVKAHLDGVAAIDTHDHLFPFEMLPGRVETDRGRGMTLASVWRNSYLTAINPITPWKPGGTFNDWWPKAKRDFDTVRAVSVYRYTLAAIQDLYGVDFETVTDAEAVRTARQLAKQEGILCGFTSGANVAAALRVARESDRALTIATVITDSGLKYLSTDLFPVPK